jgi:hypothetical protein
MPTIINRTNAVRTGLVAGLGAVATVAVLLGAGYPDPAPAPRPTPALNPVFNPDLTIKKHTQTPTDLNDWLRQMIPPPDHGGQP